MALYTTNDHRGRPVELNAVLADRPPAISADSIAPATQRRIEAHLQDVLAAPSRAGSLATIALGAALTAFAVVALKRWAGLSLRVAVPIGALTSPVVTVLGACIVRKRHAGTRARGIVDAFLAEKCCPGCGYDLSGTPADGDGIGVCPECGAAWKIR